MGRRALDCRCGGGGIELGCGGEAVAMRTGASRCKWGGGQASDVVTSLEGVAGDMGSRKIVVMVV